MKTREASVRKVWLSVLVSVALFLITTGCQSPHETPTAAEPTYTFVKEFPRGPVTFTLKVSSLEITIAERLKLLLEVRATEDYEVQLPEFGDKLEQFGIVDYRVPPSKLVDHHQILFQKYYELEPFLSGDYEIPAMKISFWKKTEGVEKTHEVENEPVKITVKSLLPENAELKIHDIVPPLEMPFSHLYWLYGIAGGVVLIAGGGLFWFYRLRHYSREEALVQRPAHEIAYDALEALLKEQFIEKGDAKTFYFQLTNILRHYIENRFALRAPEQTTEEFLADLQKIKVLGIAHQDLLQKFLYHCDMVKFAAHEPTNDDIQKTFDACKLFIAETQEQKQQNTEEA